MKVLYFARFRQITGRSGEEVSPPEYVTSVRDLIAFLSARDERVAEALADPRTIKAAINQKHVALDAPLTGAVEVAFFPPVTGG